MTEQIRVVVIKDENVYIAQCIEVDVAAQGKTPEEAMQRLEIALRAEAAEARENGKTLEDLGPAPEAFRSVYDADVVERTALPLVA